MSTSTTSYASRSASRCAVVPPTFPAPTTVIFGRSILPPEVLSAGVTELSTQDSAPLMFVFRPSRHFEVDRAHEIVAMVKVHFNLLFPVRFCQKVLWIVYEFPIPSRRILAQIVEHDDHACLHFLNDFRGTMGIDLPKLGLDHLFRRFRALLPRVKGLSKLGQPSHIGILMPRKKFVQPGRDNPRRRLIHHALPMSHAMPFLESSTRLRVAKSPAAGKPSAACLEALQSGRSPCTRPLHTCGARTGPLRGRW